MWCEVSFACVSTLSLVNDFDGTCNRAMIHNMLKKKDDEVVQEPTFATPVQGKTS